METANSANWGEQFEWRRKVHDRYPEVWNLRMARKRLPLILKYLKDGEAILDIGAFDRSMGERLKKGRPAILYKSLDVDPTYPHDYFSLDQVQERFDLVLLFEVLEHLDWNTGREMVEKIHGILNPGGRVIVTTPNVCTPGQYWKDASHRTPFHYEELGALFLGQHFELAEIRRLVREPWISYVLKTCLLRPLFRLLGIDFSKSILLVARKA